MANKQIKDLTQVSAVTGTDQFALDDALNATYKATGAQILAYIQSATDFTDLAGTPSSYVTPYSLYMVNSATDGIVESTITTSAAGIVNLPATGSFQINSVDINTAGTLSNVAYKNQDNNFSIKQTFQEDIELAATKKVITNIIEEATLDNGITFNLSGGSGKFYDYTGSWFSMSGSGTPDDGTNLYIPYSSVDGWYFGWGMADGDKIYMGKGSNQFILTGDGQLEVQQLVLSSGAQLTNFSIDGTFASASDTMTYTGLAIKTYVDGVASKWNEAAGILTPIVTTNNVNLPTGEYQFNSNILPVDGNPEHWLIGADHSKYTSIITALSNISDSARGKPYLLTLSNEEFTGDLDFATANKEYIYLDGGFSRLTGQISSYDNVGINAFELYRVGTGFSFYKGAAQTGHSYLKAAKVHTPTTLPAIVANSGTIDAFIDWAVTDQGFCLGTTGVEQTASINAFINQVDSTASAAETGTLIASNDASSDISVFVNKMASDAAGISYIVDLNDGDVSAFINKSTDFDYLLDQELGNSYITSNYSEGRIDIAGGNAHISSGEHSGNITITGGTLYANILNHSSGAVTYTPGQIIGRIDNSFYARLSTHQLVAKARDDVNNGGSWEFEGAGTYATWALSSVQDIFGLYCNTDSANYEIRLENKFAARTAKIYNDELSGVNGTVYVNAGYLTTTDPSDESLKENIKSFNDPDMVSKFKQFALKSFNYLIDGSAKTSYIAQDIEAIEPRLVKESSMPVGYIIRESEEVDEKTGEKKTVTNKKTKFEVRKGLNLDLMARYHEYVTIQLINRIEALEAKVL